MNNQIIEPGKLFLIKDIPGYTPHISRLLCMMNYSRSITLDSVKGLTVKELDYLFDKKSNSIGALLCHFAAVEYFYQVYVFEQRDLTDEELKKWKAGLDLGELAREEIKGNDLDYYINMLNEIRSRTYELFKEKTDEWLHEEVKFWAGKPGNYYFMWFHVFEDELNHRGQINLIRKRIKIF